MNRFLPVLLLMGCVSYNSKDLEAFNGRTVFARVCQHTERRGAFFKGSTTNYIGLPQKYPLGSAFTFQGFDGRFFVLLSKADSAEVRIEYIEKHSIVSPAEWFRENFDISEVKLSSKLTDVERRKIAACEPAEGMSRKAFFMALGYPARSNNPSFEASVLTYSKKRFNNIEFHFRDGRYERLKD